VGGEVANRLAHVVRPGGAVDADDADAERFENGEGRADVGAEEHPPARVERDLRLNGHLPPLVLHGALQPFNGGLDLKDVLRGLDEEHVHATAQEARALLPEDFDQFPVGDVGEHGVVGGGEHPRRADGACDEARLFGCGELVRHLAGKACRHLVNLDDAVLKLVLPHGPAIGAEGVGFQHVAADFHEGAMDALNDVGAGDDEEVVAALVDGATEVFGGEVEGLNGGSHRAVKDEGAVL